MLTAEPRAHGSSWYGATRVESPARPRLSVEIDVDVCIIGAGLAGLTAAREIALRGWSVLVLEAQSVAWDASGRNTGIVRPGFATDTRGLVERVGLEQAKELWALSVAGAEYVRNAAREMPGVSLSETGWLQVSRIDDTKPMALDAAILVGEFGTLVEPWSADRVREELRSPYYFHGLHHPHGFSLHPLNYALGLAAAAEAAGARIFEDTPVQEIDPAGVRKRIVAGGTRLRASHVVLAGSVHIGDLLPEFSSTLVPMFSTVIATSPIGIGLHQAIRYPGAVSDISGDTEYRVADGDRLIWCGRRRVWRGNPRRAGQALVREIRHFYPALQDVTAEYAWNGAMGYTVHGMPQIGEVSPGLWLLSGFGNHGLNTTAMAGELIARAIIEGDRTWQMFSPFSLVWAGGGIGRAAKQFFGWTAQASAQVGSARSRRREAKRLRAEAAAAKARQFAGLAAAAAAPPRTADEMSHAPIHPAAVPVDAPIDAAAEAVPLRVAERPEELFPESAPAAVEEAPPQQEPASPPKGRRPSKRKLSKNAETTLSELSKQVLEIEAARHPEQSANPQPPAPAGSSVDKKV